MNIITNIKGFSFKGKESIQKKEEGTACRVSNKFSSVNLPTKCKESIPLFRDLTVQSILSLI